MKHSPHSPRYSSLTWPCSPSFVWQLLGVKSLINQYLLSKHRDLGRQGLFRETKHTRRVNEYRGEVLGSHISSPPPRILSHTPPWASHLAFLSRAVTEYMLFTRWPLCSLIGAAVTLLSLHCQRHDETEGLALVAVSHAVNTQISSICNSQMSSLFVLKESS